MSQNQLTQTRKLIYFVLEVNKTISTNNLLPSIIKFDMLSDDKIFNKIMVAIDGSKYSFKASDYAIDIAINQQQTDTQLIAVTVIELVKLNLGTFLAAPTYGLEDLKRRREEAENWLRKIEKIIQDQNNNINFKSEILENPTLKVSSLILDYAEKENVDLIVVGSRGRHGLSRLLLGSIASDIVTYAHCPVLVIK